MRSTMSIWGLWTWNPRIFDTMAVPSGVDRKKLVDALVTDLAELEVLYPDASFMQRAIKTWSEKELPTWQRIATAAASEYNPIENYDRMEEWSDTGTSSGESHSTDKNVGYNVADPSVAGATDGTTSGSSSSSHTGRTHGNIGVTTSQQMLEQELDVAPKLNVYNYIIDSFRKRFCLLVY